MPALVDAPPGDAAVLVYDTFNAASFLLDTAAFCDGAGIAVAQASANQQQHAPPEREAPTRARKRRRRARSCKSREEAETQRMTHIAVERNRRRQMNEYLAALRSTMPEAYVQRVRTRRVGVGVANGHRLSCRACAFLRQSSLPVLLASARQRKKARWWRGMFLLRKSPLFF
jgi:hypothetical protein